MLKDFVLNAALLLAAFSIMGMLFKDNPLHFSAPASSKLNWGLCFGILGNILMSFSIQINSSTIADLRHLAIVIAAAFGGPIPAILAAVLIALGRIVFFGITETSLMAAIGALLIGILCGFISKIHYHRAIIAFFMNVVGLSIISVIFIIRIDDFQTLKQVLAYYYLISLIGGSIAYHFFGFIVESNKAQTQLKNSVIKLRETEERFRLIAEYSSDMITMHNEKGEYIYISPAVKEIIHFEYPDLLGKNMEHFIHPEDLEQTMSLFRRALNDGMAEIAYRCQSKFGDYVWIESTLKSVHFQEDNSKRVIIVSRNITERKLTEQKLQEANQLLNRLSYMDGLTGISNRRYFDETLEREWKKACLNKTSLSLLMFDIDYFKKYNDTYGHLSGDYCLQSLAQSIKELLGEHSSYTLCRYGGEEFALILPTNTETGTKVAHAIQKKVDSLKIPHITSEISEFITFSMGLATMYPTPASKTEELIKAADSALYLSKTKGRNTLSTI